MRVLVTRPLPDGERTAATLRARRHEVLLAPLMRVTPVPADLSGEWTAVIVSSANALRALSPPQLAPLLGLPLFAVGQRSADAAREAGFRDVHSANGNANHLVRLIAARRMERIAPHLYLAGEDRAADIAADLARHGIKVRTVVVYKNVTVEYPGELVHALEVGALDAVLHFSRRSAENYVSGGRGAGLLAAALKPRQLCLSAQVAAPLKAEEAGNVVIAANPDEASLLALLPPPAP